MMWVFFLFDVLEFWIFIFILFLLVVGFVVSFIFLNFLLGFNMLVCGVGISFLNWNLVFKVWRNRVIILMLCGDWYFFGIM